MAEQQPEAEAGKKSDLHHLEESLQVVWEKARRVSELLIRLKEENKTLQQEEQHLRSELERRELDLQRVRKELLQLQSNGSGMFSKEEKEELTTRIKELIGKINSRL
ncbi:MAG TPA: hypothetical protein VMM57_11935 [Bacteroidota bacterium]|nr:hypothetical protein [Bacteroidota bacterium]